MNYTLGMKKIGVDIDVFLASLTGDEERARITIRARQVRDRYKTVIESVYRDVAPLFLEHTNNVYIMNKNDVKTLIKLESAYFNYLIHKALRGIII